MPKIINVDKKYLLILLRMFSMRNKIDSSSHSNEINYGPKRKAKLQFLYNTTILMGVVWLLYCNFGIFLKFSETMLRCNQPQKTQCSYIKKYNNLDKQNNKFRIIWLIKLVNARWGILNKQ